jgi:hypothetical protein
MLSELQVIDELTLLVAMAKRRSDKRTPFEKAQHRLGRVYNLPAYQHTVTGLLVVVSVFCIHHSQTRKRLRFELSRWLLDGTFLNYTLSVLKYRPS